MTVEELAQKYVQSTERIFEKLRIIRVNKCPDEDSVKKVVEEARRYLNDAKYYLDGKRFETSLASIAYCEGILDAMRILGFVEFSW